MNVRSACSLLLLTAGLASAQSTTPALQFPAASPPATLKQRVGITDIEVSYSRPSMKGREIFGALAPYGEVWRTGANSATKITFSTPVKLNGAEVPAGTYELFTIPGEQSWTVIIHKNMSQWGAYAYDRKNDVVRVEAQPVTLETPVETFTIGFDHLRDESGTLYLAWEQTRVPVQIEVDLVGTLVPQIEAVMASDAERKPYAQAAIFYLEHDLDLGKAEQWMNAAITAQPEAFYFIYHKARILAKKGDKTGALAAANQSLQAAREAGGAIGSEYTRLNEALIERLE